MGMLPGLTPDRRPAHHPLYALESVMNYD